MCKNRSLLKTQLLILSLDYRFSSLFKLLKMEIFLEAILVSVLTL